MATLGIEPFGFRPDHSLAPEPDGVPAGTSLIREYFLLPEKFLLFDVRGIVEALGNRPGCGGNAYLPLRCAASATREAVAVRPACPCTPVANVFRTTAEPRLCIPACTSYPLRVAGLLAEEASVYAVLGVSATEPGSGRPAVRVPPAHHFGAAVVADGFPTSTRPSGNRPKTERKPDTTLLLTSPAKRPYRWSSLTSSPSTSSRPIASSEPASDPAPLGPRIRLAGYGEG